VRGRAAGRPVPSGGVGELDARAAREELWRRYDAGDLDAGALEARLRAVDRAGDAAALRQALDAPVVTSSPRRRLLVAGGLAVVVLAAVAVPLVLLDRDADGGALTTTTGGRGEVPPVLPPGPTVVVDDVDCPELADAQAAIEAAAIQEPAANPSLLSEPAALPDGYRVDDDEDLQPGTDPDVAMQVSAGTPPPVAIRARTLSGELDVSMRTFQYASSEEALAAGRSVVAQGVCTYAADGFEVPDRPELRGSIVEGPIPTTAFVSFRIGDRRFTVSVVARTDPATGLADDEETEAARVLAGTVAALELDAARTPPTTVPDG
jgi:hypothetical protein